MAWQTFSVKGQMRSRFSFSELSCRRPSARRPRGGPPPAQPGPRGAPCTAAGGGRQRAGPWLGLGRLEKHPRTIALVHFRKTRLSPFADRHS